MTPPDLSVIIVSWNVRARLLACLASVRRHSGDLALQLLVVDNASSDGSADAVARAAPDAELIRNDENVGFARAVNQGLDAATGRHVLLLNPDVLLRDAVLPRSVALLDAEPDVGGLGCRVVDELGTDQPSAHAHPSLLNLALVSSGLARLRAVPWLDRYEQLRRDPRTPRDVEVASGCFLMLRGEALRDVGPLDDRFFFCGEETDWCLRARQRGWRIRFAPVGTIIHAGNASGARLGSTRALLLSRGLVELHAKHGGVPAAAICWSLLALHNLSRALAFGLHARVTGAPRSQALARHFARVSRRFGESWIRGAWPRASQSETAHTTA